MDGFRKLPPSGWDRIEPTPDFCRRLAQQGFWSVFFDLLSNFWTRMGFVSDKQEPFVPDLGYVPGSREHASFLGVYRGPRR